MQFYDHVLFIAPLGTDVVNDHLLWMHVSYCSTVCCSNEQVFVWGSFLCFGIGSLWFSPLFVTLELGLTTGCLQTSGARAVAFCSPVTFFPQPLPTEFLGWAVVSTRRVLTGAVWTLCIWHLWLWLMCLVGVAYSMYHTTHTHRSHSWFNSVVCSAYL